MENFSIEHFQKLESYIPVDLLSFSGFTMAYLIVLFFILIRYFAMVGISHWIFWERENQFGVILHDKKLPQEQIKTEIKWSLVSSLIFALSGVLMGISWQLGITKLYLQFDHYTLWYLPLSFFLYSLIHEFYFYFTHLWMHRPKLYKIMHAVHHKSVKTSPWASFSFHPWETIVHASFLPILILIIPIHPVVVIFYLTFMTITAISNHLGVEIIPFKVVRDFFISGEHHSKHHKKMKVNFGLYYTFMDKLMRTEEREH